jgi:PAS domain S-box-containing protein
MNAKQAYLPSIEHKLSVSATEPELTFVTQTGGIRSPECLHDRRSHDYELEKRYEELQKAHTALEKSYAHFAELYDFAPVGYLTLDDEGIIQEINFTAAKLLGEDRENIVNQNFVNFISENYKQLWSRHFQMAKQSDGKFGCELPFMFEGRMVCYYHFDCLYKDAGVDYPQMRVTLTDVTERKLTEAEFRIIAAAFESQGGIIVADAKKITQRVNKAFTRITKYSAEDAVGKTPHFLLDPGLNDLEFYRVISASIAQNGYWQGEIWNKRKNGDLFPAWQTITAVRDAEGEITHYVGSFVDITVQKQAEKVLFDTRERLENQVASTQEELEKNRRENADTNTALSVMFKRRELDKTDAQIALSFEVEATVLPMLKRLKIASSGRVQTSKIIGILEANLQQLVECYGRSADLSAAYQKLTPLETQVASFIRQGLPTKTVASALNISAGTVNIHRKHIRKKLGLNGKADNLHSHLKSLAF